MSPAATARAWAAFAEAERAVHAERTRIGIARAKNLKNA
jgi:hypothetical protein